MAAVSAGFGRDLDDDLARAEALIDKARSDGVGLLVLPEACLGGYLTDLGGTAELPPALAVNGPEIGRLAAAAGDMVVCAGFCEAPENGPVDDAEDGAVDGRVYNSAVCVTGDGVLGVHRKVHQPLREDASYAAGDHFGAFDTPVGRIGMQICFDKAFPEAARAQALDGARIVCSLSAWPISATNRHPDPALDRWTRRMDLFDRARALDNQIVWIAANQFGTFGSMQFAASAKVVDPGGEILAWTGQEEGMAVAELDVDAAVDAARGGGMHYLRDLRPETYRADTYGADTYRAAVGTS
ncbi:MAG: carbon-nitrogen hydrolase family protein [Pseudonocardiales bacterium]|nr:carbon-nitrogen hydrolase family protein [Pseudonocardiales bacterium]